MAIKKTIIATGLSGMVGSRLVELLSPKYHFVNLDIATGIDITDAQLVEQKLSQYPSTTVIHLAALTNVSQAHQENGDKKGLVYRVNTLGTKNIALACKKFNHYLINISTDFVFDGTKRDFYFETDKVHPIEWYGQTKLWAEEVVQQSGAKHLIARLAFPFRSHFKPKQDLVRTIISKLTDDSLYPMFEDQIITPTFVDDIVEVLNLFIQKQPTGTYHLVGSSSLSPFQLAKKIKAVFNLPGSVKPGSYKEYLKKDPRPRQQFLKLSNQKLKNDFDFQMKTIDQALTVLQSQMTTDYKPTA